MRGEVVRPEVGLDLDDAADPRQSVSAADKALPEQVAGDRDGVAVVELARQPAQHA